MEIKGVIFDLDGVIVDTDRFHYRAWKSLADRLGIYFDEKINDRLRGISRRDSLEIILEGTSKPFTEADKQRLLDEKNGIYRGCLAALMPKDADRGVYDLLKTLKEKKIKTAIGSSSKNARQILSRLGLADFFDAISDGTNITKSKPDPEVFLKAAGFLGLPPENCLVVEDAAAGIEAAAAGGFISAAIGGARGHALAKYDIERLSDIIKIIYKES
ncbi:MAG: beta-phosphoglucomutase [Clostridiales bacterium]|jgi:beta-phosphoglucomutase|nr:beta-phosphoglucomutase [Clostridiales bacterium]